MALTKPTQITVPFASSGLKNTIPETATGSNRASMQEGFPAITMQDVDQGGMAPYGQDMNGIIYDVTKAIQYQQAGGFFPYDATFAAAIDGYPIGAIVTSADGTQLFQNTLDGNQSDPENGGANWSNIMTSASLAGKQDKLNQTQMDAVNSGITSAKVAIYDSYASTKQNTLTFDNTPTNGSSNPVTSDGIYAALGTKQDTITVDATPQSGSTNPVQSGGVYDELADKVDIEDADDAEVTATGSTTARTLANRFADVITVKDYGVKGDGVTDDTAAIQAAIDSVTPKSKSLFFPAGTYIISSTLTIYADTHIQGESMYSTIFKLKDNSNCTMFKTYKFDELNVSGGDNLQNYPDLPVNFSMQDIQIDGNRANQFSGTGVTNTAYVGDGILVYGRSYIANNIYIHDCSGNGFHTILRYGTAGTLGVKEFNSALIHNLFTFRTSYEGFVFEGPADIHIDNVLTGAVGAPSKMTSEEAVGTSLLFPSESIDGMVFSSFDPDGSGLIPVSQGTVEVGFIHAYACYEGYAVRMSGSATRITAENIHAEGGIGCIKIDGTWGSIDKISTRNNYFGTTSRPDSNIETLKTLCIGSITSIRQSRDTKGRTSVVLNGDLISVDNISIQAAGHAGHGVDVIAAAQINNIIATACQGSASDGLSSRAVIIEQNPLPVKIDTVDIKNCDVAIENRTTSGVVVSSGRVERVTGEGASTTTDQIVFTATPWLSSLKQWRFSVSDSGSWKFPSFVGQASGTLNGTSLITIEVNHNMWRTPNVNEVRLTPRLVRNGLNYSVESTDNTKIVIRANADQGVTSSIVFGVEVA